MGLQIWLPLNNSLKNYGVSDLIFSNLDTSITKSSIGTGKTCANSYCQESLNNGGIISNNMINLGNKISMFCWMNFSELNSSSSLSALGGQHRYSTNTGMGITIKYISSTTGYLSLNTGDGTNRTYNKYCGKTLLNANTWYHVGFTYDGSVIRLYLNGVLDGSHNYTGQKNVEDYIGVFCWSLNGSAGNKALHSGYRTKGHINDFRVYDHCLSQKEVKLLSQGLVAHYKLNANGSNNLLVNTTSPKNTNNLVNVPSTCSIVEDSELKMSVFQSSTTSTSETYIYSSRTPVISKSAQYTFSCDIWVNDYVKSIEFFWLSDTDATHKTGANFVNITNASQTIQKRNEWFHLKWTFTTKADDRTGFIRIDNNGSSTSGTAAILRITNLKLEKGSKDTGYGLSPNESSFSVADDCSGYNNNGTTSGVFQFDTDSPRHGTCAVFDGTTNKIHLPIKDLMKSLLNKQCTINFWVNEANTSSRSVYFGGYSGSDFNIEMINQKFRVYWNGSPNIQTSNIENNIWAMFSVVIDKATGIKIYKDKNLVYTHNGVLADFNFNNDIFRIGSDSRDGDTLAEGKMSDFRIYCTTLSQEDIENLYTAAGSISNSGGIFTYDFQHSARPAQLYKNGIFNAQTYKENKNKLNLSIVKEKEISSSLIQEI